MPVNAHPEFLAAEKEYLSARGLEEKKKALKKMISLAPKHKGAENLRAQLKRRYKKLKEQIQKKPPSKSRQGIKKEDMQAVIIGFTNTGKSSLLSLLTNTSPKIADYPFTTKNPIVGVIDYGGAKIQLIEIPAFESEYYDKGLVNNADVILMLINDLNQIKEIEKDLNKAVGEKIIIFNKSDLLPEKEKRKISATLQSKKYNFVIISTKTQEGIKELKEKIFRSFKKIRVYTKKPGEGKTEKPIVLQPGSTIKDVAEKIGDSFLKQIKEVKIYGPSSKFPGQKVGLNHKVKDLDIVEFKTR